MGIKQENSEFRPKITREMVEKARQEKINKPQIEALQKNTTKLILILSDLINNLRTNYLLDQEEKKTK